MAPAHWRDKGETIFAPQDHAAYEAKADHWGYCHQLPDSMAPSHSDPLTRHALSYLNGGGGSERQREQSSSFAPAAPWCSRPPTASRRR